MPGCPSGFGQAKRYEYCNIDGKMIKKGLSALQFFVLFLAAALPAFLAPSPLQNASKYFVLDNGLKVILYEKPGLPLINISAAVNVGTKDEPEGSSGLVHLLEHGILFRGTEFRSGTEISRDIRRNGAYFNAYTGQDLADFEISLPSDRFDFGLANQKEILFNFDVTAEELDKEKDIILEEIRMVRDDPRKYAASLVYQNLFKGHPYGNPAYGSAEDLLAVTPDKLKAFYASFFVPGNCSLAVVGALPLKDMEEKVRAVFSSVKAADFKPATFEKAGLLGKSVEIREEMDVKEAYLAIGLIGPDYNNPDQYAVDLLTEILGRGVNPMLNSALRARRNLVQTVGMNYSAHKYGGALIAFFTLDPKDVTMARNEAVRFLNQVRDLNFGKEDTFGQDQFYVFDFLRSAKNQVRFGSQKAQETGLLLASSLARHLLLFEDKGDKESFLARIDRVNSSDLRRAAAIYLSKGEGVVVIIVPKKKS